MDELLLLVMVGILTGCGGCAESKPESLSSTEIKTEVLRVFSRVEGYYALLGRAIGLQGVQHRGTEEDLDKITTMISDAIEYQLAGNKYTKEDKEAIRQGVRELGDEKLGFDADEDSGSEKKEKEENPAALTTEEIEQATDAASWVGWAMLLIAAVPLTVLIMIMLFVDTDNRKPAKQWHPELGIYTEKKPDKQPKPTGNFRPAPGQELRPPPGMDDSKK